jgi:hypothetical protein
MQQIRDSWPRNPKLAEALAREGRQRFPDSPQADERDALLVMALLSQRRLERARLEAYYYFDHHQDGSFGERLTYLTRVYPPSRRIRAIPRPRNSPGVKGKRRSVGWRFNHQPHRCME